MKLHLFSEAETYCFHYTGDEGKGGRGGKREGARVGHLTAVALSDEARREVGSERESKGGGGLMK